MKKKNSKKIFNALKNNLKLLVKFYSFSFALTFAIVELLDHYKYKDNIYYHEELKISNEEVEILEDKISQVLGEPIKETDNSIVLSAVMENDRLNDEEKEIIYEYKDLLDDNPYLIKSSAYNNLEKLDIIYDEEADYGQDVLGVYIKGDDEITVIKENETNDTIHHELIHCIYSQDYYESLPKFFNEGMTELLTNEYFSENPFIEEYSYPYEITMIKMLCELVGEDVVLETYSKEDLSILDAAVGEKTGLSNPYEFVDYIDDVMTSLEDGKKINQEKLESIISTFDKYYSENYEEDSIEYEMYKYNKRILNILKSEDHYYAAYECNMILNGYYVKPYFSEELKEKYPEPFHAEYYQNIDIDDSKKYIKDY